MLYNIIKNILFMFLKGGRMRKISIFLSLFVLIFAVACGGDDPVKIEPGDVSEWVGGSQPVLARSGIPIRRNVRLSPPEASEPLRGNARDLNRDRVISIYENWGYSPEARAKDLLEKMTKEEKVGLLLNVRLTDQAASGAVSDTSIAANAINSNVRMGISSRDGSAPRQRAMYNENIQNLAQQSRLRIPFLLTSDILPAYPNTWDDFCPFPKLPGMAAAIWDNSARGVEFGGILREDARGAGIRLMFIPADLATEPRWIGAVNTFGDNPEIVSTIISNVITGMQGSSSGVVAHSGVAAVVRSFPGEGAQKNGIDSRRDTSTRLLSYSSETAFDNHKSPFVAAISGNSTGIMAAHGAPEVTGNDSVPTIAVSYNENLLKTILRTQMNFQGIVFSDFDALGTLNLGAEEYTTTTQKVVAMMNAGCDVINGVSGTEIASVINALLTLNEDRIDVSAIKVLTLMFKLGLFENPYITDSNGNLRSDLSGSGLNKGSASYFFGQGVVMLKETIKRNRAFFPMDPGIPYVAPGSNLFLIGPEPYGGTTEGNWNIGHFEQSGYAALSNPFLEDDLLKGYKGRGKRLNNDGEEIPEREGTYWNESRTDMAENLVTNDVGAYLSHTEGTLKIPGNNYGEQLKNAVQFILYIMDAPEGDNYGDPVLSYYYDLVNGTPHSNDASNRGVLDRLKEDREFLDFHDNQDTLLIAFVSMNNNATAILDEVYDICDVLLLNWGSAGEDSNIVFDVLHDIQGRSIEGRLPVALLQRNWSAIDTNDPSTGSARTMNAWGQTGFRRQFDPMQKFRQPNGDLIPDPDKEGFYLEKPWVNFLFPGIP